MYAGFMNVPLDDGKSNNVFFWLYKNTNTVKSPDLIIWLEGGPGTSAMEGQFVGNGPLRIEKTGDTEDDYTVFPNPEGSWLDSADILYIDQPVDTGFSYGDRIPTTMTDSTTDFMAFLDAFMFNFNEYEFNTENRRIFISGWSFGGKYVPQYAQAIDIHNSNNPTRIY